MAAGELRRWADGLWTLEGERIRYLGFPYELRMTIVRLDDGSLFLHSPVQCTDDNRAVVDELGPVRHMVTPNKLHNLFLGHWAERYPEAAVYLPPGLPERRPHLRCDAVLGPEPDPAWAGQLDECVVGPSLFMEEVVFFHRASRTLLLGDLVENHDPATFSGWHHAVAKLNRMLGPRAETPVNWRITFYDRRAVRAAIERIMSWHPERVIVLHGFCVEHDAEEWLQHALAWASRPKEEDLVVSVDQAKRFYDAFGKRQDWQSFYEDEAVGHMADAADFSQAHAVFELGCGTGRLAERLLKAELPPDARYVGTDVSDKMVDLARDRLGGFGERARVLESDGSLDTGQPGGTFDRFVSTYVLDLMSSQQIAEVFAEAHRLLAPGGRLCLVSLTHGRSAWEQLVERAWMAAWRRAPDKLGGCRPLDLGAMLPDDAWRVLHHETVSAFGLCSEVLVASPVSP